MQPTESAEAVNRPPLTSYLSIPFHSSQQRSKNRCKAAQVPLAHVSLSGAPAETPFPNRRGSVPRHPLSRGTVNGLGRCCV